jgi:hypothetical protein
MNQKAAPEDGSQLAGRGTTWGTGSRFFLPALRLLGELGQGPSAPLSLPIARSAGGGLFVSVLAF